MSENYTKEKGFSHKFKSIIDATPLCLNLWNYELKNVLCNRQVMALFDLKSEQQYIDEFFNLSPEYQPNGKLSSTLAQEQIKKAFSEGYNKFKWLHCKLNGEEIPCEITLRRIKISDDEDYIAGFTRDLRDELMGSSYVEEYENYFLNRISERTLFNKISEISKEWYFSYDIRTSLIRFYGSYERTSNRDYFPLNEPLKKGKVHEEDANLYLELMENMKKGVYEPLDIRYLQPNGAYRYYRFVYQTVNDPNGDPVFVVGKGADVHEQKTLERRSRIDLLTECYNKNAAEYIIAEKMIEMKNDEFALFFIDIDNFKTINHNVSHHFGDEVLKNISKSIKSIFRSDDIIARIGGDEFIVFTTNPGNKKVLEKKAKSIVDMLNTSYKYDDIECPLSASVGIARHSAGNSYDDLYNAADQALYNAKKAGKNRYSFYDSSMEEGTIGELTKLDNSNRVTGAILDYELVTEVFDILYDERYNLTDAVNLSLQYIADRFNADRSYIFETFDNGKTYDNTYEFCKEGVTAEIGNLKGIDREVLQEFFIENKNGILYSNDLAATFKQENAYKLMADQGIRSFAHAQIRKDGYVTIFLGLDDCTKARIWSDREINSLQYIVKIMSILLKSAHMQNSLSELGEYNRTTMHISAMSEELSYVSDVDTYELLYINRAMLNVLGNPPESVWKGGKCYELLQGKTEPCDFCTNHLLNEHTSYEWSIHNELFNKTYLLKDKLIPIGGRLARLETATDITKLSELENTLVEKLEEERLLTTCIAELHSDETPKISISNILGHISKYFSSDRTVLFQISKNGEHLNNTYDWCSEGFHSRIDELQTISIENTRKLLDKIKEFNQFYEPSVEDAYSSNDAEYKWLKSLGVEHFIASSIKDIDGNVTGFIGIEHPKASTDKIWILESISKFVENFLNKNELISSLHRLSYYSSLTGIYNRQSYIDAISEVGIQSSTSLGVAHININKMRIINITHGLDFGDAVIKKVAELLTSLFGKNVYHTAGDEFVVVLKNEDELEFDNKINKAKNLFADQKDFTVSIGYAWNKNTVTRREENISKSDNTLELTTQGYTTILSENLKREIIEGKFVVFLQPQIEMATGQFTSAEALIRRKDAKGNIQPPVTFIPFYEKEGAIAQIDMFVLETICKLFYEWEQKDINKQMQVSVNFSRHTIANKGIVDLICSVCDKYNTDKTRLVIEITETVNSVDDASLSEIVSKFTGAGFKVSLDDFGSGHSNLSSLRLSHFDEIKIDMGIVCELPQSQRSMILTENALNLCSMLEDVVSVAEGIETVEQYNVLKELGCNKGQGYYFDKPMPIKRFEEKYIKQK